MTSANVQMLILLYSEKAADLQAMFKKPVLLEIEEPTHCS